MMISSLYQRHRLLLFLQLLPFSNISLAISFCTLDILLTLSITEWICNSIVSLHNTNLALNQISAQQLMPSAKDYLMQLEEGHLIKQSVILSTVRIVCVPVIIASSALVEAVATFGGLPRKTSWKFTLSSCWQRKSCVSMNRAKVNGSQFSISI